MCAGAVSYTHLDVYKRQVLEKQIVNTDGIKELIPELKRIGNNLNQIAKRCNEGGMLPSEAEVRKHGEELNKVWQSLRRYLQRRA